MNRNDLITIVQRLREYVGNPHHVDPMSDAFKMLIGEASEALSQAAQPKGEPIYMVRSHGSDCWEEMNGESLELCQAQHDEYEVRKLYAEQPAPVAVVMPGRSNAVASANVSAKQAYALGWNACLDEVTRLNTKE